MMAWVELLLYQGLIIGFGLGGQCQETAQEFLFPGMTPMCQ
jgi:hypothetical protein